MTCDQYRELISADLDGELQPDEEVTLFTHLGTCDDCREWRRDQLMLRTGMHQWPQEALPEAIAVPPTMAQSTPRNSYRIPRVWAWAAAVLLLIQSALTVSSFTSNNSDTRVALDDAHDATETIVLTTEDRTRYTVQSLPAVTPVNDPTQNGG